MTITTMGLDPSLSHGVLVRARWEFARSGPKLASHDVLYEWGKVKRADAGGLHKASTPDEMTSFGDAFLGAVQSSDVYQHGVPLAVDWDESTVMWRGQAIYAAKVAFLVGYIVRGFQARGTPLVILKPSEVRAHFGLSSRADKTEVWGEATFMPEIRNEDLRDALLLSYIVAASENRRLKKAGPRG